MLPRSLITRENGDVIISRGNKETPDERDWDEFLEAVARNRARAAKTKILVITDGGGPSVDQRHRLQRALSGHTFRVAVVTDSVKVRFIVSSVALLNREISTFSMADLPRACQYLGLNTQEVSAALRVAKELEAHLTR
jgi:hypothetical protein